MVPQVKGYIYYAIYFGRGVGGWKWPQGKKLNEFAGEKIKRGQKKGEDCINNGVKCIIDFLGVNKTKKYFAPPAASRFAWGKNGF